MPYPSTAILKFSIRPFLNPVNLMYARIRTRVTQFLLFVSVP